MIIQIDLTGALVRKWRELDIRRRIQAPGAPVWVCPHCGGALDRQDRAHHAGRWPC